MGYLDSDRTIFATSEQSCDAYLHRWIAFTVNLHSIMKVTFVVLRPELCLCIEHPWPPCQIRSVIGFLPLIFKLGCLLRLSAIDFQVGGSYWFRNRFFRFRPRPLIPRHFDRRSQSRASWLHVSTFIVLLHLRFLRIYCHEGAKQHDSYS